MALTTEMHAVLGVQGLLRFKVARGLLVSGWKSSSLAARMRRKGGGGPEAGRAGLCSETPPLLCLHAPLLPTRGRLGGPPWPRPQPPASPRGARPLGEGAAGAGSSAPLPPPRLGRGSRR